MKKRKKRLKIKREENKMRDAEIYKMYKGLEKPVISLQRSEEETMRQIISLRIQLNAIICVFKILLPLNCLYRFFYNMEWKKYSRQLKQRQRLMQRFTKVEKTKGGK